MWSIKGRTKKFGDTSFSSNLIKDFESNLALYSMKKVDSLFELLSFYFHFLLQLFIELSAFCWTFLVWVSKLAVAKIETSSAYIAVITCTMVLEFTWWNLPTLLLSLLVVSSFSVFPTSLAFCSSRQCKEQIEVVLRQSPVEVLVEFYG